MSAAEVSMHGLALDRLERVRRRGPRERRWMRLSLGLGIAIIALAGLLCVCAPLLPLPNPNTQDYSAVLQPPSWAHPFGTDEVGRDVFSRTLWGGRLDLSIAMLMTLISFVTGTTLGGLAGFQGGRAESVIMRVADIALAFPFIVLVISLVTIFGPGLKGLIVGVPLVGWAIYARLTRAEMLVVREQDYMLAARVLGLSRRRILLRHGLPNLWRAVLVFSVIDVVLNITLIASFSYLGLGVQPPTAEWGAIVASGQQYLLSAWWISTLPGLVIVLAGVGFSLVGDAGAEILGRELTLVES
jgi:peptide/nickel transport system permease protein